MTNLHEAMNTYEAALQMVENKGYQISLEEACDELSLWVAAKEDLSLSASNPLSLLGLLMIAETYGSDWQRIPETSLYDKILEDAIETEEKGASHV